MAIPENIRVYLEQARLCVMATISADGSPHLTVMWYDLIDDILVLNMMRGLVQERNLRRDPRIAICVEDGPRYVTLSGRVQIIEDRVIQEAEVIRTATRYRGPRLGAQHWREIMGQDRLGIHMRVERVQTHGFQ